jgi:crotonobetainyl-CoA:carnitine CoA-transferase CaiB-like acyl-CoA transferase
VFLKDVLVVDLCVYGQGPLTAAILSDLGARVVKVEDGPAGGDPMRNLELLYGVPQQVRVNDRTTEVGYEFYSHGKESIALDFGTAEGRAVLDKLLAKADVVTHNLRQKRLAKFDLGYEAVKKVNPSVVYLESLAFGSEGPWADSPGFDGGLLAYAGMAYAGSRSIDGPDPLIGAFGDYLGGLAGVVGVLAALVRRSFTGQGGRVETSQLGALTALQSLPFTNLALTGEEYRRFRREQEPNPLYNVYRARDDQWLVITGIDLKRDWANVCQALGRGDLAEDARAASFEALRTHSGELIALFDEAIAGLDRDALLDDLRARNVFCAPVFHTRETFNDEQVRSNGYIQAVPGEGFDLPVWPVKLDGIPAQIARRAPTFGEHTDSVLDELGYTADEIEQLRTTGVVR